MLLRLFEWKNGYKLRVDVPCVFVFSVFAVQNSVSALWWMGIGKICEMKHIKKNQTGLEAEYNKTGERDIMRYPKGYIQYILKITVFRQVTRCNLIHTRKQ